MRKLFEFSQNQLESYTVRAIMYLKHVNVVVRLVSYGVAGEVFADGGAATRGDAHHQGSYHTVDRDAEAGRLVPFYKSSVSCSFTV